jgi:hypothetical protein
MPKALLVVFTNPTGASTEDEFNDWYTNTHLNDVLSLQGYVAATRYKLADVQMPGAESPRHRYLALYEVDVDDLQRAVEALGQAAAAGEGMYISPALDRATATAHFYERVSDRVQAKPKPAAASA